ncbi:tyrosine-type recombinase/integrase [Arcobacter sp.]|uniref:tyrosine-type recombinase/integrase n=1 Tax=Arcobacter sp. TaxID=1872629 RepID=UPI003D109FAD
MKYLLDIKEETTESFIFWLKKFTINKVNTTSQRQVKDKQKMKDILAEIECSNTIDELEHYFKSIRNNGFSGFNIYHQTLKKLYDFIKLKNIESLKKIDNSFLIEYLNQSTKSFSNATKKNYRTVITIFFNFIDKYNYDEENKIHSYYIDLRNWEKNSITAEKKIPTYLNESELKEFFSSLEIYKKQTNSTYRNSFILKLILLTGLRSQEVINVKYSDIEEYNEFYKIGVVGKGNKYREVLIQKIYLEEYLNLQYLNNKTDELVFKSDKKGKLTQAYISRAVEQVLTIAKIKKAKKGTHLLRHTFATQLYRKNKDVVLVKNALGHSDINTSMIYTHIDNEELIKTTNIMNGLI